MVLSYPFKYDSNLENLVLNLTTGKSQEEAFEELTNWVSENVEYDNGLLSKLNNVEKGDYDINDYIINGEINLNLKDSLEVFKQRKGICCETSYLLVTMARIAGINAEFVNVNEDLNGDKINHACVGAEINGIYVLADPVYKKFNIAHRGFEPASVKKVIQFFRKANGGYTSSDDAWDYAYAPKFIGTKKAEPEKMPKKEMEWQNPLQNSLCSVVEEATEEVGELSTAIKKTIKFIEGLIKDIDNYKQSKLEKVEKPERKPEEHAQKSEYSGKNPSLSLEEQRKEQKSVDAVRNIESRVEQEMTAKKQINNNLVNPINKSKESRIANQKGYSQKSDYSSENPALALEEQRKEQKSVDAVRNIESRVEQEMTAKKQINTLVNPTDKSKESKIAKYEFGRKLFWPAVVAASILFSFTAYKINSYMKSVNEQHQARIEYILKR